jgi:uncharacterized protein YyaL (SSP411 family)
MVEQFEDGGHGGFFSSAEGDDSLVMRIKDDYDGAEPAGNSVAAMNLLRLSSITAREDFHKAAERTLAVFSSRLSNAPVALPYMLAACELYLGGTRQIVFAGARSAEDMQSLLRTLRSRFVPNSTVLMVDSPETRGRLAGWAPAIGNMQPVDGRPAVYVCRDFTCQLPVSEPARFSELLQ